MNFYTRLFIVFVFSFSSKYGFGSDIQLRHLAIDAQFSKITVNGLFQDEYGVLWVGTKDGVKKYNGSRIESVNLLGMNNWVQSNFVPTICGDRNGHVYINTDYHIIEYNLKTEQAKVIFRQKNTQTLPLLTFHYGKGALWIGIKDSIFHYDGKSTRLKYVLRDNGLNISAMKEAANGTLYVGTKHDGLFAFQKSGKRKKMLSSKSEVISIYEDSKQNIWTGTFNDGLFKITDNLKTEQFTSPRLSSNYVRAICEDDLGNMWIGTMLGLDILDKRTESVAHYGLAKNGKPGLSNLSVWVITKDDQGTMWVGTYYGGLDYYNFKKNVFKYYDLGFNQNGGPIVSKIVEDKYGTLWVGTEGNGLISYKPSANSYSYYTKEQTVILHNNIKALYYDKLTNIVWIGTHLGGLSSYAIDEKKFTNYTVDASVSTKRSEIVQAIVRYKHLLFIGTLSGVYYMDLKSREIKKITVLDKYIHAVNALKVDEDDNLWIGGNSLCCYDINQNFVRNFDNKLNDITSSLKNTITSLSVNSSGKLIVGTAGSGVLIYDGKTDDFIQVSKKNSSIASDYISTIFPLSGNYLLVGGIAGLSCIDITAKNSYNYDRQNGFTLHSMIPGDIIQDSKGNMVMGGLNGMASVNERDLFPVNLPIKIYFSKLWINNKEVQAEDSSQILKQALLSTNNINLKYDENNIAIETGTNNFVNFGQPQYQYLLEGYDKQWVDFRSGETIRYMNLPYGKYVLKVRNKMFGKQYKSNEISMAISVTPPVYATWYAYLFYCLAGLSVAASIFYFYYSRLTLRTSLELERRDKQQKDAISESKMRFLGNISHELKTPVTLISGQLELMLMSENAPTGIQKNLREVHSRTSKMSLLINELLDFLKYNKETFKLRVAKKNIVYFTNEIIDSFMSYAELKRINLTYRYEEDDIYAWFDDVQLQKVFNNILSNAFKFTAEGGEIEVSVERNASTVCVKFKDNGIGIPSEMTGKIFERFFQVDNPINADLSTTGTGIGLSLSQNIVNKHQGQINVESKEEEGSMFVVELPLGIEHFQHDDQVEIVETEQVDAVNTVLAISDLKITEVDESMDDLIAEQKALLEQQATILIVEDDAELRRLLIRIFEPIFHVYEAENGEEAFKIAQLESPDLILSDIMMSGISGISLCARIKGNFDTSHIPVVLLTALSDIEYNIKGFNSGADEYITKPFDIRLLVTRCVNLLNNRIKLQESYRKQENNNGKQITANPLDQAFIDKAVKVIEDHLESGNVDIGLLCSELAISRTKLFLKMKGITGQTPHDFIQNIKLKAAAKMLRDNQEQNVSDIAYYLGFSSLNYFGKTFKDYFGMSPSTYRKSSLNKE